jgi:hypothetical protein
MRWAVGDADCLTADADVTAHVLGSFTSILQGKLCGEGMLSPPPPRIAGRTQGAFVVAVAMSTAADACCELVAFHPCGHEACPACEEADYAAGFLASHADLFWGETAIADGATWAVQLASARRRPAV